MGPRYKTVLQTACRANRRATQLTPFSWTNFPDASGEVSTSTVDLQEKLAYLQANGEPLHNMVVQLGAVLPIDVYSPLLARSLSMLSQSQQIATASPHERIALAEDLSGSFASLVDSVQEACSNNTYANEAPSQTIELHASSSTMSRDLELTNRFSSPQKKQAKKR